MFPQTRQIFLENSENFCAYDISVTKNGVKSPLSSVKNVGGISGIRFRKMISKVFSNAGFLSHPFRVKSGGGDFSVGLRRGLNPTL